MHQTLKTGCKCWTCRTHWWLMHIVWTFLIGIYLEKKKCHLHHFLFNDMTSPFQNFPKQTWMTQKCVGQRGWWQSQNMMLGLFWYFYMNQMFLRNYTHFFQSVKLYEDIPEILSDMMFFMRMSKFLHPAQIFLTFQWRENLCTWECHLIKTYGEFSYAEKKPNCLG